MALYRLSHISVENFKSIETAEVDIARHTFHLLSGPNGSGKTNFLEAISFGLGSSITRSGLRVDGIEDLAGWGSNHASAGRRKRTAVHLTFLPAPASSDREDEATAVSRSKGFKRKHAQSARAALGGGEIKVGSSLIGAVRHYYLNGTKATKKKVQRVLSERIGLPRDGTSWFITQQAVQGATNAKPKDLFDSICDVAGTYALRLGRRDGLTQIEKGQEVLRQVATTIESLHRSVSLQQQLSEQATLYGQLSAEEVEVKSDTERLWRVEAYANIYTCGIWYLHHTSLIEAKQKEIASSAIICCSDDGISAVECELEEQLGSLQRAEERCEACRFKARDATDALMRDEDSRARDTVDMDALTRASIMLKEKISDVVELELPECQRLLLSLDNSPGYMENCETDWEAGAAVVESELSELSALEQKLGHRIEEGSSALLSGQKSIAQTETLLQSTLSEVATVETWIDRYTQGLRSIQTSIKTILEPTGIIFEDNDGMSPHDCLVLARATIVKATALLREHEEQLKHNNKVLELPQLMSPSVRPIEGDYGFLADVIQLAPGALQRPECAALSALLFPFLGVRLCRDSNAAAGLVSAFSAARVRARIWPIESLILLNSGDSREHQGAKRDRAACMLAEAVAAASNLQKTVGGSVIHPTSLLRWSEEKFPDLLVPVVKALCGWVIVDSDITAIKVMKCKPRGIYGCITFECRKHIPGQLLFNSRSMTVEREQALCSSIGERSSILSMDHRYRDIVKGLSLLLDEMSSECGLLIVQQERCMELRTTEDELTRRLAALKEKQLELEVEAEKLSSQRRHNARKCEMLHNDLNHYRTAQSSGSDNYHTMKRLKVEQQLRSLEARSAEMTAEAQHLKEVHIAGLRSRIDEASRRIERNKTLIAATEEELLLAEESAAALTARVQVLERQFETLSANNILQHQGRETMKQLQDELSALRSANQLRESVEYLKQHIDTLDGDVPLSIVANAILPEVLSWVEEDYSMQMSRILYRYSKDMIPECSATQEELNKVMEFITRDSVTPNGPGECIMCRYRDEGNDCILRSLHDDICITSARAQELPLQLHDVLHNFWSLSTGSADSYANDGSLFVESEVLEMLQKHRSNDGALVTTTKKMHLLSLKERHDQISKALVELSHDLDESGNFIAQLHQLTYERIRVRTRQYFADLVTDKAIDLVPVKEAMEAGLKFVLIAANGARRGIDELSGGQKSLLSLSYVFACALHRQYPLYLMDEIDAALDEKNQKVVARIISKLFQNKIIFCVSHHPDFQVHAAEVLTARMVDEKTAIRGP